MMEILDAGTEAETCRMAGKGMNGLRGTVVCFNASNQRYTLELQDSGEMMSLRARNVVMYHDKDDTSVLTKESAVVVEDVTDDESIVSKETVEFLSSKNSIKPNQEAGVKPVNIPLKKKPAGALPKYEKHKAPPPPANDVNAGAEKKKGGNIVDRIIYGFFNNVLDMSPSVMLFAVFSAYAFQQYMSGAWSSSEDSDDEDGTSNDSTGKSSRYNDDYYDNDYHYYGHRGRRGYYSSWGHYGWSHMWHWGYYGLSGLFSVLVVAFFVWQFGTKKGAVTFRWDHVKTRVAQFDFWEVMRYGMLLEGAFLFITRMAAGAGGGGGGGGRRRR